MTEQEKDAIRAKVAKGIEKMEVGLADQYLGKKCPMTAQDGAMRECEGPKCAWYHVQIQQEPDGKMVVTGAGCVVNIVAQQLGPIAGGLFEMAQAVSDTHPKIMKPPPGMIR